jgi:hypothetical protein
MRFVDFIRKIISTILTFSDIHRFEHFSSASPASVHRFLDLDPASGLLSRLRNVQRAQRVSAREFPRGKRLPSRCIISIAIYGAVRVSGRPSGKSNPRLSMMIFLSPTPLAFRTDEL